MNSRNTWQISMQVFIFLFILVGCSTTSHGTEAHSYVRGVTLGSTLDEVFDQFSEPLEHWESGSSAEKAAEQYDQALIYDGIEFYFLGDKVDYIRITNDKYPVDSGLKVGDLLDSDFDINIGDSDCYVDPQTESDIIVEIRIFCAM